VIAKYGYDCGVLNRVKVVSVREICAQDHVHIGIYHACSHRSVVRVQGSHCTRHHLSD
jgi:hypothetical protein